MGQNINIHDNLISSCPHCLSTHITLNGKSPNKQTQRYKCKNCQKTFKATTGTPTHWMHNREKITKYIEALQNGYSIRKAAIFAQISKNTSFAWRHKFLSSIPENTTNTFNEKQHTIKIIKTPYSAKGRKKAPEKFTNTTKTILINNKGQIQLHKINPFKLVKHTTKILQQNNTISEVCTFPSKLLTNSIKQTNVKKIKIRNLIKQLVEQTNSQEKKLNIWMKRFRGVATKYLQHYWKWFCLNENIQNIINKKHVFTKSCIENRTILNYKYLITQ